MSNSEIIGFGLSAFGFGLAAYAFHLVRVNRRLERWEARQADMRSQSGPAAAHIPAE